MSRPGTVPRRSVIRGVRGLGNIVYLSAVLTTLAHVPGVNRVVRVRSGLGEIEVDGLPSRDAIGAALAGAAALMASADLRSHAPGDAHAVLPVEVVPLDEA